MKLIRLSVWFFLFAALACLPVFTQETPQEEDSAPPTFEEAVPILLPVEIEGDQKDLRLELVVHRWTDRGSQDEGGQRFSVSIKEQPAFMENIRWEGGPEIEFAPGEHSKTLPLIFDTAAAGRTSEPTEEAQLVLLIEALHEAVIPPERELEIPLLFTRVLRPGGGSISICALREDTPEEFPIDQANEYCDPGRQPVLRSDRIVLFFTPARDITEPIREDQYFFVRVVGPNGDSIYTLPFWNKGTEEVPELSIAFAAEGAPGRLAIPLDLWRANEDPDPERVRTGPGTYTIRTVGARVGGTSTFGQGESRPLIDGEWRDEGTFEIGGLRPVFAGFVAEDVNEMPLPRGAPQGSITIGKPAVSGTSVSIDMSARWQRWPGEPEQRAASRLTLNFPEELVPDFSEVGGFDAKLERLEQTEDDSLFFTAGVHHQVTTNVAPPDRYLVEGAGVPKLWEELEHRIPPGCRGGAWLWKQGERKYQQVPKEGDCSFQLELKSGYRRSRFGTPERGVASHLHDKEALWVIPVFFSLVDSPYSQGGGRRVDVRSYGYALYASKPYTGPGPAGRPESGDEEGEEISDVAPDSGGGAGDTGSGTSTTASTGTGPGTGPGPEPAPGSGTPSAPPPVVDPSNSAGLDPDRQPQVANLVREWLTVAEPPENAVQGVNFRYDEFGRKVGIGATVRTIRTHDTADYGSGPSPEARVWSEFRTTLDSIDHCVLEEYVVARLQEQGIDHCRGRYGAVRDLGGVPLAEARREVEVAGFTVGPLAPGSPAPTPEASGTVERQEPSPVQHLRRGDAVTLVIHTPHISSTLFAPDLVNLRRPEAKRRLQELGLGSNLMAGTAATVPEESDLVEAQRPAAGGPIEPGASVTIWVRPAYVAISTLPNVVGMSMSAAKAALTAVGIDAEAINVRGGSSAPSAALAGKVESQEPAAGWTVDSGGKVTLEVHSGFVDVRTVPPVVGLTEATARQSLAAVGLQVRRTEGAAARSQGASGTVLEQSPAAGTTVSAGSVVELSVYAAYVPPSTPVPPPPTPPRPAPPKANRESGLPPFQCPASVALTSHDKPGLRAIPIGTQLPLNPANSGFKNQNSVFVCGYGLGNINLTFVHVHWTPLSGGSFPQSGVCGEDSTNMLGTRYVFSRRYVASVWVFNSGLDFNFGLRMAQQFFSQLEGYARLCPGASPPTVRQTPPPPQPAIPPACPGPQAPPVYTLHFFGEPHVNICGNRSGKMWINVSNNIHPINSIQRGAADPDGKCWSGTQVVTPRHTYTGRLCQ